MNEEPDIDLTFTPRSVIRTLGIMAAALVAISLGVLIATSMAGRHPLEVRLAKFFYLDAERNLPTAFSTLLHLIAAVLLTLIAVLERRCSREGKLYWAGLSAGFVLMGVDEAWSFHEQLNAPVRALLGIQEQLGVLYYTWVVPAIVFVALLALPYARFLWRLPAVTRTAFLVAAALFLGGAIGAELLAGLHDELHGDATLASGLLSTLEEALEMAGVIVFIRALLAYVDQRHGVVRLRFR
jgi:hypothetical protein